MVSSRHGFRFLIAALVLWLIPGCGGQTDSLSSPTASPAPTYTSPNFLEGLDISPWYQLYGGDQESSASDVIVMPDGGYLIVGGIGQILESEMIGGVMLLRTDPNGELLWQEVYGGDGFEFGASIIQHPEGGYLIAGETSSFDAAGTDGYLLHVDQVGSLMWSTTIGGELNETINTILPAPQGGYFLIGNIVDPDDFITDPGAAGYGGFAGRSNIFIAMMDEAGEPIWSKVIENPANVIASEAVLSADGSLYILANLIKFPQPGDDLILTKIDPNGELLWTRTWEDGDLGGHALARDLDDNLVITGLSSSEPEGTTDLFILKVDPEGGELFFRTYGSPEMYESGRDIIVMGDGNYVVLLDSTESYFSGTSTSGLLSVDTSGALLWESQIDLPYTVKSAVIHPHPQGGFVITGGIFSPQGEFRTILIRTDASGATE